MSTDKVSEISKNAQERSSPNSVGEDSTSEVPRSSEDSQDKDNNALSSLEVKTEPPDASGLEPSEVPELSEDSTREVKDAPSGREVDNLELSAGTTDLLSSRDSEEVDKTALSTEDSIDNISDAVVKPSVEEESSEEEVE